MFDHKLVIRRSLGSLRLYALKRRPRRCYVWKIIKPVRQHQGLSGSSRGIGSKQHLTLWRKTSPGDATRSQPRQSRDGGVAGTVQHHGHRERSATVPPWLAQTPDKAGPIMRNSFAE